MGKYNVPSKIHTSVVRVLCDVLQAKEAYRRHSVGLLRAENLCSVYSTARAVKVLFRSALLTEVPKKLPGILTGTYAKTGCAQYQ